MKAKEIMSTAVKSVNGMMTLEEVKTVFSNEHINAAPVLKDDGEIEGIITSYDLNSIHNTDLQVRQIMTRKVQVCSVNARVVDVANTMTSMGIHHVLVMDDGKTIGMISSLDVIKALLTD